MKPFFQNLLSILDRKSRFQAAVLLVLIVIGGLLELLGVILLPLLVLFLSDPHGFAAKISRFVPAPWVPSQDPDQSLTFFLFFMAAFFIFKSFYLALSTYLQANFQSRAEANLSQRLLSCYLLAPYERQFSAHSSRRVYIMLQEAPRIFSGIVNPLFIFSSEWVVFIFLSTALFLYHPLSFLSALGLVATTSALLYFFFRRRVSAMAKEQSLSGNRVSRLIHESLGGLKEIKALGREKSFLERFGSDSFSHSLLSRHLAASNSYPRYFIEAVAVSAIVLVVMIMTSSKNDSHSDVLGNLAFFSVASIRLLPCLNRMLSSFNNILGARYALDEVCHELAQKNAQVSETVTGSAHDQSPPVHFERAIEFRDVSYQYPGADSLALDRLNMTIQRGTTVAITGPSGAGKTTCADILLGLLSPVDGRLLVDGKTFRNQPRNGNVWMGYIPQVIYLTDDSIARNIAFGVPDHLIDEKAVMAAAEAAQLTEFLQDLPQGLHQTIGEHGLRLSGGQRQRIGIARALYHQPEVLVMDEATSSLDNETERAITAFLHNLHGRKTIIVIAHRLSTIQHADRIFFLTKGSVAASGTYTQLLQNSSAFSKLARAAEPTPVL